MGAMNLSEYCITTGEDPYFDYYTFGKDVRIAVRYLNEVLDEGQPLHPLKEQRDCVKKWRQIGLGFMGLADLFIKMEMEYGSIGSVAFSDHIGYTMITNAIVESIELAKEFGSFPACNPELICKSKFWSHNINQNPWITEMDKERIRADLLKYGIRNSQLLTCAPTGTISTIFNVSGGIEPVFALKFTRTTKSINDTDTTYTVYPAAVKDFLDSVNASSLDELQEDIPDFLVTSRDIPWSQRIDIQAAWQKHIDASISATINLPESTTVEEIADLYMYAHEAKLKGVTVFRENCKRVAILNDTYKEKAKTNENTTNNVPENPKDIPDGCTDMMKDYVKGFKEKFFHSFTPILTRSDFGEYLHGTTYYKKVACGHIYITVNRFAGRPVEVFMQSSKSGGCAANTEALGRLASTMLRAGIDPEVVVDSTLGVKCAACSTMKGKGESISGLSCSDVMARVIKEEYNKYINGYYDNEIEEYLEDFPVEELISRCGVNKYSDMAVSSHTHADPIPMNLTTSINKYTGKTSVRAEYDHPKESDGVWNYKVHTIQENIDNSICPECGSKLRFSEGCMKCDNCGFSKC